ncbi:MAG: TonB family protein [Bacteroidota bacterium]
MSTSKDPSGKLEDYILAVEKKEKQMRMVKVSLLAILITGGTALAYFMGVQPYLQSADYQRYFASELSFQKVDSLLSLSPKPILIKQDGREQFDTIREIEDYIQFELNESPELIVVDNLQTEFVDTDAGGFMEDGLFKPANIALDIAGDRKVGNKLSFKIIPLGDNKLPLYEIDFGNGLRKKIKSNIRYAYPSAGHYYVYVRSADENEQTLYKLPLVIGNSAQRTLKESTGQELAQREQTTKLQNSATPASTKETESSPAQETTVSTSTNTGSANTLAGGKQSASNTENPYGVRNNLLANSSRELPKVVETVPTNTKSTATSTQKPSSGTSTSSKDVFDPNAVFELPSFPGGSKAMNRFISRRLRYPKMALNNKVEGIVVVKFQVDPLGGVSKPKILKSIGFGCDEEVLRILSAMPDWKPATKNGQPIQAVHSIAINFKIQN